MNDDLNFDFEKLVGEIEWFPDDKVSVDEEKTIVSPEVYNQILDHVSKWGRDDVVPISNLDCYRPDGVKFNYDTKRAVQIANRLNDAGLDGSSAVTYDNRGLNWLPEDLSDEIFDSVRSDIKEMPKEGLDGLSCESGSSITFDIEELEDLSPGDEIEFRGIKTVLSNEAHKYLSREVSEIKQDSWREEGYREAVEATRKTLIHQLVYDAQKQALKMDNPQKFSDRVEEVAKPMKRYRPSVYYREIEKRFRAVNVLDGHRMGLLSTQLNTCLVKHGEDADETVELDGHTCHAYDRKNDITKEATDMYEADPFTFIQAFGSDDRVEGYVRSFVMEDSDDDIFLGVDTIEIDATTNVDSDEEFRKHSDKICCGALAAIDLGKELGVEYVAGKDARIAYGPRQAYSNTSKNIEYRKLGDPVPYYSVNWEDPENKEFSPGFRIYGSPEEEEVRGFNTMPGHHETEVKLLMEF